MENTTGRVNILIASLADEGTDKKVIMDLGIRDEVSVCSISASSNSQKSFAGIAQFHDPCDIATIPAFGKTN